MTSEALESNVIHANGHVGQCLADVECGMVGLDVVGAGTKLCHGTVVDSPTGWVSCRACGEVGVDEKEREVVTLRDGSLGVEELDNLVVELVAEAGDVLGGEGALLVALVDFGLPVIERIGEGVPSVAVGCFHHVAELGEEGAYGLILADGSAHGIESLLQGCCGSAECLSVGAFLNPFGGNESCFESFLGIFGGTHLVQDDVLSVLNGLVECELLGCAVCGSVVPKAEVVGANPVGGGVLHLQSEGEGGAAVADEYHAPVLGLGIGGLDGFACLAVGACDEDVCTCDSAFGVCVALLGGHGIALQHVLTSGEAIYCLRDGAIAKGVGRWCPRLDEASDGDPVLAGVHLSVSASLILQVLTANGDCPAVHVAVEAGVCQYHVGDIERGVLAGTSEVVAAGSEGGAQSCNSILHLFEGGIDLGIDSPCCIGVDAGCLSLFEGALEVKLLVVNGHGCVVGSNLRLEFLGVECLLESLAVCAHGIEVVCADKLPHELRVCGVALGLFEVEVSPSGCPADGGVVAIDAVGAWCVGILGVCGIVVGDHVAALVLGDAPQTKTGIAAVVAVNPSLSAILAHEVAGACCGLAVGQYVDVVLSGFAGTHEFEWQHVVGGGVAADVVDDSFFCNGDYAVAQDDGACAPCLSATKEEASSYIVDVVLTSVLWFHE